MKTFLVTGGTGFLGSNFVRKIMNETDNHVIILDNDSTGSFKNISEFIKSGRIKHYECDISLKIPEYIYSEIHIDDIYNFASPASPVYYLKHPIQTTKTNVLGIINLLEIAKIKNARLFQASTSEVYGDAIQNPQNELYWGNVNPTGVRACYDEGKRCAESLIYDYVREYSLDVRVVRIFNTYGPNMQINDGRVVSHFINQALLNKNITIHGNGLQTRSLCYVDDTISGIIKLMQREQPIMTPVNIGNPSEISILELAERIIDMTQSTSKIVFTEPREDDPKQRRPDISLALRELDWSPAINLEDGLKRTIDYFMKENIEYSC
ncbi:GDP-mannose 4,6-dehydratase [Paenibacillus lautus]|uniref:GDP-mannose 4,6-dehydratase n=1 Tax=Paenibacillus lautus TaxID=1401 RepID=UPI003D2AEA4B